jgi:hypothetical protein
VKPDDATRVWIRHVLETAALNPLRGIGYSTNGSRILKSEIFAQLLIGLVWLIELQWLGGLGNRSRSVFFAVETELLF